MFVLLLLCVNLASTFLLAPAGQARVKVPFSPYFLSEVQAGRVASIVSTGNSVQGTFKAAVRYPTGDEKATPTTLFATEVPTFWNNDQLTTLLQTHGVQINAQSTVKTTSFLSSLLLGFGPTLLIVGLIVLRHAACGEERRRHGRADELWAVEGAAASIRRASSSRLPTLPGSMRRKPS